MKTNTSKVGLCSNCEQIKKLKTVKTPLCFACWHWENKKGKTRPKALYNRQTYCSNCEKENKRLTRGLCCACYVYFRKHGGKHRPKKLYQRQKRPCRNPSCTKPLDIFDSVRGYCIACYSYRRRRNHKGQRPKHLCDTELDGGIGWCECSRPARIEYEYEYNLGMINERNKGPLRDVMILCEVCYRLEIDERE